MSTALQTKLLGIFGVLLLIGGIWYLGYRHGYQEMEDTHEKYKQQLVFESTVRQTLEKKLTDEITDSLSLSFTDIDQSKEQEDENIEYKYTGTIQQYTSVDGLYYDRDTAEPVQNPRDVSATSSTRLGKISDDWGLSSQDRKFLIEEAKRADTITSELRACKAYVLELYAKHESYIKGLELMSPKPDTTN